MAWFVKQQAITWATFDPYLYRHIVSLDHNELTYPGCVAEVDASVRMVANLLREKVAQTHDKSTLNLTNVDVRIDAGGKDETSICT